MKDIKLEEGEIICDNCHGKSKSFGESFTVCMKCWGTGKLDWVEACVGKAHPVGIMSIPKLKKVYPKMVAKDLLSVKPMTGKV